MAKKIELRVAEQEALERLAKVSKMDCWFSIDEEGRVHDLERGGRIMSTYNAVRQLISGVTDDDLDALTPQNRKAIIMLQDRMLN